jgi:hypothetical protein
VHTVSWWGNLRERSHLEDPGVDGRIMIDGSPESGMGILDRWRALVNAVIKLRV